MHRVRDCIRGLGACTYIIHLKSRCTETDSVQFLLDLCCALCTFLLSEREGGERGQKCYITCAFMK